MLYLKYRKAPLFVPRTLATLILFLERIPDILFIPVYQVLSVCFLGTLVQKRSNGKYLIDDH